jgi:hypothetical protein
MDMRTITVIAIVIAMVAVGIYYLAGPGSVTTTKTTPPAATAPETPPQTPTP